MMQTEYMEPVDWAIFGSSVALGLFWLVWM